MGGEKDKGKEVKVGVKEVEKEVEKEIKEVEEVKVIDDGAIASTSTTNVGPPIVGDNPHLISVSSDELAAYMEFIAKNTISSLPQSDKDNNTSKTVKYYFLFDRALANKYLDQVIAARASALKNVDEEAIKAMLLKQKANASTYFPDGAFSSAGHEMMQKTIDETFHSFKSFVTGMQCFAYAGFDPNKMLVQLAACQLDRATFLKDMVQLLSLLFIRGTNVETMLSKNTASEGQIETLKNQLSLYQVKKTSGSNPSIVTLPRLSMVLPLLAMKVFYSIPNRNQIVTSNDIGMDPGILAYGFSMAGLHTNMSATMANRCFFIHNICQCFILMKTRRIKKLSGNHISDLSKYAKIAEDKAIENISIDVNVEERDIHLAMAKLINICTIGASFEIEYSNYHRKFNLMNATREANKVVTATDVMIYEMPAET